MSKEETDRIINPKEDMHGNKKENIFLVFDQDQYVGCGYLYPNINQHMTPQHPLNIYTDIEFEDETLIKSDLFNSVLSKLKGRALELKAEYGGLETFFYGGYVEGDKTKYNRFVDLGLNEIEGTHRLTCSRDNIHLFKEGKKLSHDGIRIDDTLFSHEDYIQELVALHNEYFVQPVTFESMKRMLSDDRTFVFTALVDQHIVGNVIVQVLKNNRGETYGLIDDLFVHQDYRGRKIGKVLINHSIECLLNHKVSYLEIEVWSPNQAAYDLYRQVGFQYIEDKETYPGTRL